jgi:outer membrane protein OmpA-like peptidoglycan-associated protein
MSQAVQAQVKAPPAIKPIALATQSGLLQRQRSAAKQATPSSVPSIVHDVLRSPGQPLDIGTRTFMEPRFGHDFSNVRVHTDTRAAESARAVNALAYTVGRNVVFGTGQYAPEMSKGRVLLAHELAHVVQQRGQTTTINHRLAIGKTDSPLEQEADQVARVVGQEGVLSGEEILEYKPAHRLQQVNITSSTHQIMRVPDETGIKKTPNPEYSYSTNCGWIDWGHAIPNDARDLIGRVREASMRLKRAEANLAADAPTLVQEDKCPATYDEGEVANSVVEQPTMTVTTHPANTIEFRLGGFGVDSSDTKKFNSMIKGIGAKHTEQEQSQGKKYAIELSGFTDCIGSHRENFSLRMDRSITILSLLTGAGKTSVRVVTRAMNQYLASNASREGRRQNRGVLIRLIPAIQPEKVITKPAQSGGFGIVANKAVVTTEINRSLNEEEILSVALSVFAQLELAFEGVQKTTDKIKSSSFSEEDLPSDLISFYRAARGFSREEVAKACDSWDQTRSLSKLKGYQFQRNHTFLPPHLPPGGKWPAEFSTIKIIAPGSRGLYDIVEIVIEGLVNKIGKCFRNGGEVPCRSK